MHTVFALLCFVVVIHWLIFPYPSGLLHWHCGNPTIAPVPAKQPWCIWINTSCDFIMNDCITTTKQSTTKPCAYFLGYTVAAWTTCSHVAVTPHDVSKGQGLICLFNNSLVNIDWGNDLIPPDSKIVAEPIPRMIADKGMTHDCFISSSTGRLVSETYVLLQNYGTCILIQGERWGVAHMEFEMRNSMGPLPLRRVALDPSMNK